MDIGWKVRRSQWDPGSNNYRELKEIRREITVKRLEAIKLEKALAKAKSSLYSINKTLRMKVSSSITTTTTPTTTPTTSTPRTFKEDNIEFVSIHYGYDYLFLLLFLSFILFQYR